MAALYRELAALTGSPVVELNRAVAVAMAGDPAAALALVDALGAAGALDGYHLFHSVRADLLERLARPDEAADEWRAAAALAGNDRERALLEARVGAATGAPPAPDPAGDDASSLDRAPSRDDA
jgi:predicted RNA polymerase sigma factor